uniref:multidrug effflux MFS transporter n=1 Tax=Cellvibrio fontiphilus TaxID=1815559 RepID=UPI002B4BFDFF|nr:multidrug effflux MFS transporter [Cellvibrio fontiphilus]
MNSTEPVTHSHSEQSTHLPAPSPTGEFIVLVALMMSMTALAIDAVLPAFDMIRADIVMAHPNQAQLLISLLFAGLALGQLVSGPLSDALGRKKILYAGLGLFLLGTVLCIFAQDLTALLLGRFVQGLGVSGPYICAISIVRDKFAGRQMAKIMSVVMMIFITVPALAPSIGQAIMLVADWRAIFVFYLIFAAAVIALIFLRLEETLPREKRIAFSVNAISDGFKTVISNRLTAGYTLAMGLFFGCFLGYINSSQQILQELYGTGKLFTVYFGGLALVLGFASFFNSRFVERLGMHFISRRAIYVIIASSVLFLLLQFFITPALWMFVIYASILFFSFGLVFGNLNAIAMEPMGHVAGIAAAVIGASSSLISMGLGTYIGQAYNQSVMPVTLGFIIVPTLGLLATLWADGGSKKYSAKHTD